MIDEVDQDSNPTFAIYSAGQIGRAGGWGGVGSYT